MGSQRGVGRSHKSEAVPLQKAQFHPLLCTPSPPESPGPPRLPLSSAHGCGPGPNPGLPPAKTASSQTPCHLSTLGAPTTAVTTSVLTASSVWIPAISLFHSSGPRQLRASWPSSINPGSSLNGPRASCPWLLLTPPAFPSVSPEKPHRSSGSSQTQALGSHCRRSSRT